MKTKYSQCRRQWQANKRGASVSLSYYDLVNQPAETKASSQARRDGTTPDFEARCPPSTRASTPAGGFGTFLVRVGYRRANQVCKTPAVTTNLIGILSQTQVFMACCRCDLSSVAKAVASASPGFHRFMVRIITNRTMTRYRPDRARNVVRMSPCALACPQRTCNSADQLDSQNNDGCPVHCRTRRRTDRCRTPRKLFAESGKLPNC